MSVRTVSQLIATSYTLTLSEFLDTYRDPMFIGVGILDAMLLKHKDTRHNTLSLGLEAVEAAEGQATRHHLMGFVVRLAGPEEVWDRLAIGRTKENDIVVDDPAVSEYHAYIKRYDDGRFVLGDLGSTNGTQVNGAPLKAPQTHILIDEDIVTLGRCSFQFFTPKALYDYLGLGD